LERSSSSGQIFKMAQSRRVHKVAERLQDLIASELLQLRDPRLSLLTITSVIVSSDLRHAKVYYMTTGDKSRIEKAGEALAGATGRFRQVVGRELGLRFVPELRFYYDDTLDAREEVERLLERAKQQDATGR
jgi:ribosome-binding factor A